MATGEWRSAYSMTEPHAGSDVQAIRTRARRDGDEYVIDGQKMWVTNGLRANMIMLLAVTDPQARPRHRGMTAFILQKDAGVAEQPGLLIPPHLKKLGYRGVESTELVFDGFRTPAGSVLGGESQLGQGFKQFMAAVELGRVNVAARAVGLATCALEQAIAYAKSARDLRQADQPAPGHPAQARPDGDPAEGRRAARGRRRPAQVHRGQGRP